MYKNSGSIDSEPIFIVGMPRSGTTLIEQILSSHPKVYGGDELNFFTDLINKYFKEKKQNEIKKELDEIFISNAKKDIGKHPGYNYNGQPHLRFINTYRLCLGSR